METRESDTSSSDEAVSRARKHDVTDAKQNSKSDAKTEHEVNGADRSKIPTASTIKNEKDAFLTEVKENDDVTSSPVKSNASAKKSVVFAAGVDLRELTPSASDASEVGRSEKGEKQKRKRRKKTGSLLQALRNKLSRPRKSVTSSSQGTTSKFEAN